MATAELAALHAAYAARIRAIRATTVAALTNRWDSLDDYRDATAESFAASSAATVTGAQQQVGSLTDAYLSRYETTARGVTVAAAGVPPQLLTDRAIRGVDAAEVYRRPFEAVWSALSQRDPLELAVEKGRNRLVSTTQTDLQLAKTHAARHSARRRGVRYYRRELEGKSSCGLCITASTQRYTVGDLMPIHPACDCSVAEIYADVDPGQVLEPERLGNVHDAIKAEFGAMAGDAREIPGVINPANGDLLRYRDVLVVNTHGEIGPVLGVRRHSFTGPDDL